MAANTGHPGPVSQATYWKRRVFVLAGVLVVVALLAWAFSGPGGDEADDDPSGPIQADTSREPDGDDPEDTDGDPSPEPSPGAEGEDGDGDGEAAPGGGSGGSAETDGGGGAGSSAAAEIPEPRRPEDLCRPADVVVTVETDRETYAGGQEPEITLTLVNTGEQTCTVDVGGENMELRFTSGQDRIFSTADCADDDDTEERQLEQGRAFTTTFTWDRTRSWSDCRDERRNAGSGWYVVRLHSLYDLGAEPQPFQLR